MPKGYWIPHLDVSNMQGFQAYRDMAISTLGRTQGRLSALIQLPSRIQVVEIKNSVEHERIRPDRLATIERIDREQHHVPLLYRRINDCGALRDVSAAIQQS